ncbi:AAA family ATPase [Clostridium sporogenes]|uniref:AAA family ATPase n=1 Tax=Clostridium botulinum TaxID=1491 RepID=A0A6M0SUX0_CLOBO|nr:AAA family ATPase [Clostridium sporogenes]NFA59359.1 AAA family ATPase [Clostridium botulinum]NFI75333.1 AAA family ATPase [Clostridium sporogenes]NFL74059.1 AAA family ATPase [Clostridium sporogenes]NFM26146.1 AAA family ATPase [Clostridium sporogenes]NFP63226.1 AAA family ATPase [Clostridium sporogenes]
MQEFDDFFEGLSLEKEEYKSQYAKNNNKEEIKIEDNLAIEMDSKEIDSFYESGLKKINFIEKELNDFFVEREEVIKDALRALVIGQHMFLYGPPGTGKSLLVYNICKRIDGARYFQWLLNKTSDPAEILGPYSIKAMEQDKFLRKTSGKLPEAHIAFIDEIWKSNEPTLNILLPLLNEKIFYNDGKAIKVPLVSMFCASNEIPDDESLNALYDRIIFRDYLGYVKDTDNKLKMFKNYINMRKNKNEIKVNTKIKLEEIYALQKKTEIIEVKDDIYLDFIKLMDNLERDGIFISDRRKNECLKVIQGNALLCGRNYVIVEDLEALKNVLWNDIDDITIIETNIIKVINPYDDKVRDYTRKFNEIKEEIDYIEDKDEKIRATIEAKVSIENIIKRLNILIESARNKGKDTKNMINKRKYIEDYNESIMKEVLGIDLNFEGHSDI